MSEDAKLKDEQRIVIETTAKGVGGYMSLFDAYNMADVVAVDYGATEARVLAAYAQGDVHALSNSLDALHIAHFDLPLAPAWPSVHLTKRAEPRGVVYEGARTNRLPPRKPKHKATTRAGKQHRIKGAR